MTARIVRSSALLGLTALLLTIAGCGGTRKALLDVTATPPTLGADEAYQKVTAILIDKNFDIKQGQKDLGLLTTEYKQFGSSGGTPPFDFYLQIRTTVKTRPDGKLVIKMVPAVKQQNRMNAAAFTEETLRYFDEKTVAKPIWLDSTDQVRLKGQLLFI